MRGSFLLLVVAFIVFCGSLCLTVVALVLCVVCGWLRKLSAFRDSFPENEPKRGKRGRRAGISSNNKYIISYRRRGEDISIDTGFVRGRR